MPPVPFSNKPRRSHFFFPLPSLLRHFAFPHLTISSRNACPPRKDLITQKTFNRFGSFLTNGQLVPALLPPYHPSSYADRVRLNFPFMRSWPGDESWFRFQSSDCHAVDTFSAVGPRFVIPTPDHYFFDVNPKFAPQVRRKPDDAHGYLPPPPTPPRVWFFVGFLFFCFFFFFCSSQSLPRKLYSPGTSVQSSRISVNELPRCFSKLWTLSELSRLPPPR